MNFIIIDLMLLVLFILITSYFLYKNKKNLAQEGSLILYKTSWGIKLINYIGNKHKKFLNFLSYFSIGVGFLLMISMIYLIINTVYLYLTSPLAQLIKAPPIAPLIPYFPTLFGMESFFPPFYFIYFIVAILIVATFHEFFHGIFAKAHNIKIKSTGFAFFKYLPAMFGAFVEQDDKQMLKTSRFQQMSVLAAGVFANILLALIFYFTLFGFFSYAFAPVGVTYNSYAYAPIEISEITSFNGIKLENPNFNQLINLTEENKTNILIANNSEFVIKYEELINQNNSEYLALYFNSPAYKNKLPSTILSINGITTNNKEKLSEVLSSYSPDEEIQIKTKTENGEEIYNITLQKHPEIDEQAWLGIIFYEQQGSGLVSKFISIFPNYIEDHVYYEAKNDFSIFIKDFLWWIFMINLLVALFNMLPFGFLDGGRFFYLTIEKITDSKKIAENSFNGITKFLLFLLIVLMIKWVWGFF